MRERDSSDSEEIIVRSLKQPSCVKVDINDGVISYVIEKELGIELVDDIKIKIDVSDEEEPWEEIVEDSCSIDEVNDNFIDEI